MSQFNVAALDVYNLDPSIMMTTFKGGLQQYPFLFSLKKRPVTNFSEMLARAEKYACAEEGYGTHIPPTIPSISSPTPSIALSPTPPSAPAPTPFSAPLAAPPFVPLPASMLEGQTSIQEFHIGREDHEKRPRSRSPHDVEGHLPESSDTKAQID